MNASITAKPIPGIPEPAQQQLFNVLLAEPNIQAVWLMAAVDDLLLPWQVDLVLRHELPPELEAHLQRVGQCLWSSPAQTSDVLPLKCS